MAEGTTENTAVCTRLVADLAERGLDASKGMLAAQGQFRRVKGYQELPRLALALERATAEEPGMLDLPSAVSA